MLSHLFEINYGRVILPEEAKLNITERFYFFCPVYVINVFCVLRWINFSVSFGRLMASFKCLTEI